MQGIFPFLLLNYCWILFSFLRLNKDLLNTYYLLSTCQPFNPHNNQLKKYRFTDEEAMISTGGITPVLIRFCHFREKVWSSMLELWLATDLCDLGDVTSVLCGYISSSWLPCKVVGRVNEWIIWLGTLNSSCIQEVLNVGWYSTISALQGASYC